MSKLEGLNGMGALALAFTLVIATFLMVAYAMSLTWPLADILQIAGIFVPFVASAVAFYLGNKNTGDLIDNEKQRINNEKKRLDLAEKGIKLPP